MLPNAHVVKVGGRSIIDAGRPVVYPLVDAIGRSLAAKQADPRRRGRACARRHVFSIGIDLGLPTGRPGATVGSRCQRQRPHPRNAARAAWRRGHSARDLRPPAAVPDQRGSRGHLQRRSALFAVGASARSRPHSAPPHGRRLLSARRVLRMQALILVKDVDGLYDKDPKEHSDAALIREISVAELREPFVADAALRPRAVEALAHGAIAEAVSGDQRPQARASRASARWRACRNHRSRGIVRRESRR